jgi:hypothetical protein
MMLFLYRASLSLRTGLRRKEELSGASFGTTTQPLLPLVASGEALKWCPDTCLVRGCEIE